MLQTYVLDSMHERKALMISLSDAFVALPGGFGTIEEFFVAITCAQLGLHRKPCGLLNTRHYYDSLVDFLDHGVTEGFLSPSDRAMIVVEEDPDLLLDRLGERLPNA